MTTEGSQEKKVLLIENDLFLSSKITETLKQIGYPYAASSNLKEINGLIKSDNIFLIVVDLSVETFNPLSLIQKLKNKSSTAEIPIIAFAEHTQKELLEGAANAGCEVVASNRQVVRNLANLMEVGLAGFADSPEPDETETPGPP